MVILEENLKWHLEAFASELFIYSFKKKGSVPSFAILHVQIFIQQTILGAMKLVKMIKNAGGGSGFFVQNV